MSRSAIGLFRPFIKSRKQESSSPLFRHSELPDSTTYLRLLEILPVEHNQRRYVGSPVIRCKIQSFATSDQPIYEALSYTWGDSDKQSRIELNGNSFPVTENLFWFLHYHSCRSDTKEGTLIWIDAICIDQENTTEKGHQVQMMGSIYRNAQRVIVWLDPGIKGTEENSKLLSSADRRSAATIQDIENTFTFLNFAEQNFGDISIERKYMKFFQNRNSHLHDVLDSLFQLPYWNRSWIVQEVVLAKSIVIRLGPQEITWHALDFWTRNSNNIWSAMGRPPQQPYRPVRRFQFEWLLEMRSEHIGEKTQTGSLYRVIERNVDTHCKDPRDRVYAFLGLVTAPSHAPMIQADYTMIPEELFFSVMLFVLAEERGIPVSFAEILIKALRLPWPEHLDPEKPGEIEDILFDSAQVFNWSATLAGFVSEVQRQTPAEITLPAYTCVQVEATAERRNHPWIENGIGNGDINQGDSVYQFPNLDIGFIARASNPAVDSTDPLHIVSKLWIMNSWDSVVELERFHRRWDPQGLRVRKENMSNDGATTLSFKFGRREFMQLLFDELRWCRE